MEINGININFLIILFVAGALLLATSYHFILYLQQRTRILAAYSIYLFTTFSYVLFRAFFEKYNHQIFLYFYPDEVIQMLAFAFYIRFMGIALQLDPEKDRRQINFVRVAPKIIFIYCAYIVIAVNFIRLGQLWIDTILLVTKMLIRVYLLFLGYYVVINLMRRRIDIYYRYLTYGATSLITFGLISAILHFLGIRAFLNISPVAWMIFGFFIDVLFFSAAIGYRLRMEYLEKEKSLKELMAKETALREMEMEKIKAIYETREEERLRISRDIHDDMGSSLSSISIYAKVASSLMQQEPDKALDALEKIRLNAEEVMEKTYDTIWSLQTNYGSYASIFSRMEKTAKEWLAATGIICQVTIEEKPLFRAIKYEIQKGFWLIFKEALHNVSKYSKAEHCRITVEQKNEILVMIIADDGMGFHLDDHRNGNGLKNMRERATEMGASLFIHSKPAEGTVITIQLYLGEAVLLPA